MLLHSNRALHGETPVSIAFNSRKKDLIDLLDKDHLLPRDAGPILETSIVDVRYLHLYLYNFEECSYTYFYNQ